MTAFQQDNRCYTIESTTGNTAVNPKGILYMSANSASPAVPGASLAVGGETYYRLRDVAASVTGSANQFDVSWNGGVVIETKTAYTGNVPETSAAEGAAVTLDLTVDGQAVSTAAMLANGNYYVPASFLTTLGVAVGA